MLQSGGGLILRADTSTAGKVSGEGQARNLSRATFARPHLSLATSDGSNSKPFARTAEMTTVCLSLSSYSSYRDSRSQLSVANQHENLGESSTVYVGNLSFFVRSFERQSPALSPS